MTPWIILTISIIIIILAVIALVVTKKKKEKKAPNYYSFFLIGLVWFPFGIIMTLIGENNSLGNIFTILGLVYLTIGLANKKDWGENQQISKNKNKTTTWIILILLILFITGITAYIFVKGIIS